MSIRLCVIGLIFGSVSLFGQKKKDRDTSAYIQQPDRIEFNLDRTDGDFTIINGYEDGLMVVKETYTRHDGGYGWALYRLDTALQIVWTKLRVIPAAYSFRGWDYSEGNYYLLFASAQYNPERFAVFQIPADGSDIEEIEVNTVFPMALTHFEIIDNAILFGGTTNFRPAILTIDLEERKPRVVPGIYNTNTELVDIYLNDENGIFSVALLERLPNRRLTLSVRTYTSDNMLIQNNLIDPGERKNLIDGAPTDFTTGFQYVAGAYSNKSTQYSRGLYLTKFMNGRQQFIKYYNYADLKNFFEYMGKNRRNRIQERISRRKSLGKNNKFNYRLVVHEIVHKDDEYIMIGEAYYPRYSNYQSVMPYGTGRYAPSAYKGIIGYKYTHAIVVSFDRNGNILWDQSFPIDDVFSSDLEELVKVNVLDDRIELLYLEENLIRSKVIKGNEVLEGKSYTPVRLGSENDEFVIRDPDVEGLEKWYDDVLFAFGKQEIEHRTDNFFRNRRSIFYINKVSNNPGDYPN